MGEFSVHTDRIVNIAELLEKQAKELEQAGESIESLINQLKIEGAPGDSVRSAMRTTGSSVRQQSGTAGQMGRVLKDIAQEYRNTEKRILGRTTGVDPLASNGGNQGGGSKQTGPGSQKGNNKDSGTYSSDPVNLNTGNFILENTDMEIDGFQAFGFVRYYNSMGDFTGVLGKDWNTGFEMKISFRGDPEATGTGITVILEDGREEYFVSNGKGGFLSVSGSTAEITLEDSGFLYTTLEGNRYLFNRDGRFVRFEDPHHVGYSLSYENGVLKQVEKDSGEFFALHFDGKGQLESVSDHAGRCCRYYFENGCLTAVEKPDGGRYEYSYNPFGKICRVINPNKVQAVETEYDSRYRVTFQKFADGTTNRFEYRDSENAVVMTERNGSISVHCHDSLYRNVKNIYADGEEEFEYNEHGQKTLAKDKLGNITRLQYDNRGNLTGIITPDKVRYAATYDKGNRLLTVSVNGKKKLRNQYNGYGDLISTEDGLGRCTCYQYDDRGRVTAAVLPDDSEVRFTYDERGNLCAVNRPDQSSVSCTYDLLNRIASRRDAKGNESSYVYDIAGRLVSEIRPDGSRREYGYDDCGNNVYVQEFDGSLTTRVFNENNRLSEEVDPAGRKTRYEYDSMWNIAKVLLPNGGALRYLYDANNRLEAFIDAEDNETHYRYDSMGNLVEQIYPEGFAVSFGYDAAGRCTEMTMPDGSRIQAAYNEEDQLIYIKDAENTELYRTYDEAGQLIFEKDSQGRSREYEYDVLGNLVSERDESGIRTSYIYEKGSDRLAAKRYADGTAEYYTYDLNGNPETHTDIYGQVLRYRYDELDRMIAVEKNGRTLSEYTYDGMGRILSEKDHEGRVTGYVYTETGMLRSVTDPLGNTAEYSYNAADELIRVIRKDPRGEQCSTAEYERNLMGLLTKLTDSMGNTETYRYDGLERMVEKIDRENFSTRYSYSPAGLLSHILWADGKEVSYEYTPAHQLSRVQDWTGTTRMSYENGSLTEITYPDQRRLQHQYDRFGNRTGTVYPDGQRVSFEYDLFNRLTAVRQAGASTEYSYNEKGDLSARTVSDGTQVRYEYNEQGMLSRFVHSDREGILDDFSLEYDLYGRRTKYAVFRRDAAGFNGVYEYGYDGAGHLKTVSRDGQLLRSYGYDPLGRRSSRISTDPLTRMQEKIEYEYDRRGGLLSKSSRGMREEFRYDRRGNLIQILKNGHTDRTYSYDASGRLARSSAADGREAAYRYNGLGYRVGMDTRFGEKQAEISYVQDYGELYNNLYEKTENGKREAYIWGMGLESFTADGGAPMHCLTDPLGSVLRTWNSSGTACRADYDEFGNMSCGSGSDSLPFGYNGFQMDAAAGTWFAQARQYRSETGTFDGMDRFGGDITQPETLNPYVYCVQDPFSYTDRSGYWFGIDDAIAAGIGAIGGVAGTFVGDVITSVSKGKVEFSSWQKYTGAAIGGAAGGVTTLYAGPIAGGAVSGAVSTLTSEGLTYVSDPKGYTKSGWDVAKDTAVNAGLGALSGAATKLFGKIAKGAAKSGLGQKIASKLSQGGKISSKLGEMIRNTAAGRNSTRWSQLSHFLKNQHETIAASPAMRQKLGHILLKNLPVFMGEAILSKVKPKSLIVSTGKKKLKELIDRLFGNSDQSANAACAAA